MSSIAGARNLARRLPLETPVAARLNAALGVSLLAVAAVARFWDLGGREVFRDEAASWVAAVKPLPDLLAAVVHEAYPPLYLLLLKGWMSVFGDGLAALRSLSAVAGLATAVLAWAWARRIVGPRGALAVLAIVAVSPAAIDEARNARMYAFETAFATAAWLALLLAVRGASFGQRRRRIGYAVVLAGLAIAVAGELWTLAYGVPIAALQLAAALYLSWRSHDPPVRRGARRAAIAIGAGIVAFAPWAPFLLADSVRGDQFWTPRPDLAALGAVYGQWLAGEGVAGVPLAGVAIGVAVAGAAVWLLRRRGIASPEAVSITFALAIGPIVFVYSQVHSIFDVRYLGAILPPLAILLVAAGRGALGWLAGATRGVVDAAKTRARRSPLVSWLVSAAVVVSAATVSLVYVGEWRRGAEIAPAAQALEYVAARAGPGDLVLAADPRSYFAMAYLTRRSDTPIHLSAPVLSWEPSGEPGYWGAALVPDSDALREGGTAPLGGRWSESGRVWLVVLRMPNVSFAPERDGAFREVERQPFGTGQGLSEVRLLERVAP